MLGDDVVATAILDLLLHHSRVITIQGDSYRLRKKRRAGMVSTRASNPRCWLHHEECEVEAEHLYQT